MATSPDVTVTIPPVPSRMYKKPKSNLPPVSQRIPFKTAYFVVLIIDFFESVVLSFLTLLGLFDPQRLIDVTTVLCKASDLFFLKFDIQTIPNPWHFRLICVILLVLVLMIQVYGWRGYNYHDIEAIHVFAIFKGLIAFAFLIQVYQVRTFKSVITFCFCAIFAVVPLAFAEELYKIRR